MARRNFDDQGNSVAVDPLDEALRKQMQAKVDTSATAPDASAEPGEVKGPDYTPPPITTTTSPAGPMQTQPVGNGMSITTNPGYTINDLVNPKLTVPTPPPTPKPTPPPTTTTGGGLPALTGRSSDPSILRQYVASWAGMEGADPSLKNDPDYWVRRITETGGLGNDNLKFWQDAGVGPTAFFRNPGRESGGKSGRSGGDLSGDNINGNKFGDTDQGAGVGGSLINSLIEQLMGPGGLFGSTTSGGSASGSAYQNDPLRQQMMAALSKLIQQGQEPVGDVSNDPSAVAYRLARTRGAEKSRSAAAERRASQGLLFSGPMESDIAGGEQLRDEDIGNYEGQLATTILQDRKQKLEYALTQGAGMLQQDQQLELQRQLQETNKALQDATIKTQLINALLQNQRFYDDLGFKIGDTELNANQNAIDTVK